MADVYSFDSVPDMQRSLSRRMDQLDAQVLLWQEQLRPGDCYLMVAPDDDGRPLYVYGEIIPLDEEDAPLRTHSRQVKAYSYLEPDGEYGLIHVATVLGPLLRSSFELARELGWPSTPGCVAAVVADDPRWRQGSP